MKARYLTMSIDARGLPVSDYGTKHGIVVGPQRSIAAVAAKGLDYWNVFCRQAGEEPALVCYNWDTYSAYRRARPRTAEEGRAKMFNCADWLLAQRIERDGYVLWEYPFPFPAYGLPPQWRSAHAQASAMRLLLRAYDLSGNEAYRACVHAALPPFEIPIAQGGMLDRIGPDEWWYAKFAHPAVACPRVLNGMMFALLGLHDVAARTHSRAAQELFEKGVPAVVNSLACYDAGRWSNYDRYGKPAPEMYHVIHMQQLALLYRITGIEVFSEYRAKFASYRRTWGLLRKVTGAVRSRVAAVWGPGSNQSSVNREER